MSWVLDYRPSEMGESSGSESRIGFRGSRFSISQKGRLYLTDYGSNNYTFANDPASKPFVVGVRQVMGPSWAGRIRIRGNGDVYSSGPPFTYVGNLDRDDDDDDDEIFPGYRLSPPPPPGGAGTGLSIYTGPHNHGQVGERWTIPTTEFANRKGQLGNIGVKYEPGDWMWSVSNHSDFIGYMRGFFHAEKRNVLRFYITNYGHIVRPVDSEVFSDYGINIKSQLNDNNQIAPASMNSARDRLDRAKERGDLSGTLYFVCGHVDELMGGKIPVLNINDPRIREVNMDRAKWR